MPTIPLPGSADDISACVGSIPWLVRAPIPEAKAQSYLTDLFRCVSFPQLSPPLPWWLRKVGAFFMPLPKKPTGKLNNSHQTDPDLQRAQATLMVQRRIQGLPMHVIAKEFNVAPNTVTERLNWAKKQGILDEIRNRVFDELLGPAVDALKLALAEGNVEAAKAVLFGTGVLEKNPKAALPTVELTLKEYRSRKLEIDERDQILENSLQDGHVVGQLPAPDPGGREDQGDDPERE